jgi:hypothetical protein
VQQSVDKKRLLIEGLVVALSIVLFVLLLIIQWPREHESLEKGVSEDLFRKKRERIRPSTTARTKPGAEIPSNAESQEKGTERGTANHEKEKPKEEEEKTGPSIEVIKKIALQKAEEVYGRVTPGEPIPCYANERTVKTYLCPFKIGDEAFPSEEDLREKIDTLRSKLEAGDGQTVSEKIWGAGEYCTVVVSATYDQFPIPLYRNALSAYHVNRSAASEVAEKFFQNRAAEYTGYYFLGHRGEYFEFSCGGEKVLVHAYLLKTFSPSEILIPKEKWEQPDEHDDFGKQWKEYQRQAREEWEKLIKEVGR